MVEKAFPTSPDQYISITKVSVEEVIDYYSLISARVDENVERMIRCYPLWEHRQLSTNELGQLAWYLSDDPAHVSHELIDCGKHRSVLDVSLRYLSNRDYFLENWDGAQKVEAMIESLKAGKTLPPLIIVPGSRYPDSPDSSFVDGVHRAVAFMVYALETEQDKILIPSYVGRKATAPIRILNKIKRSRGG